MKNNIAIKIIVLGIIFLLVGTSTIPALNANPEQTSTKKTNTDPGEELDIIDMKSTDGIGVNKFITPAMTSSKPDSDLSEKLILGHGDLPPGFEARSFDQNINDDKFGYTSLISNDNEISNFVVKKLTPESTEGDIGANKCITPTLISGKPYIDTNEKLTPEQEDTIQGTTKEATNQDVGDGTFDKISFHDGDSKNRGGSEYFLHISDIHWGEDHYSGLEGYTNWNLFINGGIIPWYADNLPEFILCTGDIVEYGGSYDGYLLWEYLFESSGTLVGDANGNWQVCLQTISGEQRVPIFFSPGNHDFRCIYQVPSCDDPYGYLDWVRRRLNPAELDYVVDSISDVRIFSMNSGFDDVLPPPWLGTCIELPEGDGFAIEQMIWLNNQLDALDGEINGRDDSELYKIVMFHHPYINKFGRDLYCGDGWGTNTRDGTFLYNRNIFIRICNQYGIDLACWGHTHNDAFTGVIPGTLTRYSDGGSLRDSVKKYNMFPLSPPLPILPSPKVSVIQTSPSTPDIVLFSYEDNNDLAILDSSSNLVCMGMLDKGEYYYLTLTPGMYTIEGDKTFSVLTGDPVSSSGSDDGGRGFYAVDGKGRGASTELFTYMPSDSNPHRTEQFIVFSYTDGTKGNITTLDTSEIIPFGPLAKGQHYDTTAVCGHYIKVESNYPVSALSYAGQGYYVPSANKKFSGTEFYTYTHASIPGGNSDTLWLFAYKNGTHITVKNSIDGTVYWDGIANDPDGGDIELVGWCHSIYDDSTSSLIPRYYTIISDKPIIVGVIPGDPDYYGTYVPATNGKLFGTDFSTLWNELFHGGSASGCATLTAKEDSTVVDFGGLIFYLNASEAYQIYNPFPWGMYIHVQSNKPISLYSSYVGGYTQNGGAFAPVYSGSTGDYDIFVDDDNVDAPWLGTQTHPYQCIQQGVDSAVDGDVIFVAKGTYSEAVTIDKSLTLVGEDEASTIIDGSSLDDSVLVDILANDVTVQGFIIKNSKNTGIGITGQKNVITKNIVQNNIIGIKIIGSAHNILSKNMIDLNTGHGIYLDASNDNTIIENTISNNGGIHLVSQCTNNLISHNNFIENSLPASDDGSNAWCNVSLEQGNYWSDYQGSDSDGDGIGDTPYVIQGDNKDHYPLMNPSGWTTLHVKKDAPSGWYDHNHVRTIQEGINNASDFVKTVYVYPGNYNEQVVVNKTLILEGQSKDTVIVDGTIGMQSGTVWITCDNVILKNFTIKNNNSICIEVRSNYNTIMDNIITGGASSAYYGLVLKNSCFNTITGNTIRNILYHAILLDCSTENIFRNNTITFCYRSTTGFTFENKNDLNNDVDQSNTVDGHHLLVLNNVNTPMIIDGTNLDLEFTAGETHTTNYGVINLYKCSNIMIRNCSIDVYGEYGIYFYESSWNVIEKSTIHHAKGILLDSNSCNNIIRNSTSSENYDNGIFLQSYSNYNIIKNNKCTDNSNCGIYLENYCNNNLIENNNCSNDCTGIFLEQYSCYNQIQNNTIIWSLVDWSAEGGIVLAFSSPHNLIKNNTCTGYTDGYGILIWSDNNIIRNNNFSENHLGLEIYGASNRVFHNIFINNEGAIAGWGNSWNNTYPSGGNYWSDYLGGDIDGDGIGETKYYIDPSYNPDSNDSYPFIHPNGWMVPPTVSFTYLLSPIPGFIQFNDTSIDPNGVVMSWHWDFGDGYSSEDQNTTHWYRNGGTYTVTLTVTDDDDLINFTTQQIVINHQPVANDDTATVTQDTIHNQIDVLANDTDLDGDPLEIIGISLPEHGKIWTDGLYAYYTPESTYIGSDSFTYNISDGQGGIDIGTVTVDVLNTMSPVITITYPSENGIIAPSSLINPTIPLEFTINEQPVQIEVSSDTGWGICLVFPDDSIQTEIPLYWFGTNPYSAHSLTVKAINTAGYEWFTTVHFIITYPIEIVYIDDEYDETTPGWGIDHFASIQDGINAVAEGGTVTVANGIYNEILLVNKAVHLIGEDKNTTMIDNCLKSDLLTISADGVCISGFSMIVRGVNVGVKITSNENNITDVCILSGPSEGSIPGDTYGIYLESSLRNTISGNTIQDFSFGVYLDASSSDNYIYHNNFIINDQNAYDVGENNLWDDGYPSGGNYWDDYTGADTDGDDIGNTPYIIQQNGIDSYPLIQPWPLMFT